jgi:hypothetical protein
LVSRNGYVLTHATNIKYEHGDGTNDGMPASKADIKQAADRKANQENLAANRKGDRE